MTNKPMLSVERELLERAVSAVIVARGPGSPTERDLRAILDNPSECRCKRYGKDNPHWPCPVHAEPAAQHQGEPVAKYAETVPKFKFETLVEHCKRLESDLAQSRARVNEITLYQENAVWFWQHDGEDYLQSLSCPIIIQPHHLRELLEGKAQHNPLAEQPAPLIRCSFCDVTDNAGNPWSGHHESVDGKLIYRVMGCKDHKHLVEALDGSKTAPVAVTHTMRSVMEAYAAARKEHLTGTSNFCAAMADRLNGVKT